MLDQIFGKMMMSRAVFLMSFFFMGIVASAQVDPTEVREEIRLKTNYDLYLTGESVHVALTCSLEDQPSLLSQVVYLELIDSLGEPKIQLVRDLNNGWHQGTFFLSSNLGTGNYALVAYTNWMKNNPSTFFRKTISVVNPYESISPEIFQDSAAIEEAVNSEISARQVTDIAEELKTMDSIQFSIAKEGNEMENLMLSINKIDSRSRYQAPPIELTDDIERPTVLHLPEMHGHILKGLVRDPNGNKIETEISLSSPTHEHPPIFTRSDRNGSFNFIVTSEQRNSKILLSSNSKSKFEIVSPFFENHDNLKIESLSLSPNLKDWILKRAQQIQIEDNYFDSKYQVQETFTKGAFASFTGASYVLDEYKRFPAIEDPIVEYIPEASLKIQNKKKRLACSGFLFPGVSDSTLVLLNGLPVTSQTIFSQNASYIERITVYPGYLAINDDEFKGIVHFESFDRFAAKVFNGETYLIDYTVPQYESVNSGNESYPDFGDQLLWKKLSEMSFDNNSFNTTLNDGKYEIVLMDMDGKILGRDQFSVN